MTAFLLAFLLIQVSPAPKGFATGVVRSTNGSPAAGVRVYAVPAGDPNVATRASVIESLAQTDASGRYRLEIPAGRYYIAVGSVSSPTYYPDTASIAAAKAISIAAGTTVESVDFSRYTAAASPLTGASVIGLLLPPGSTAVLSGVVRNSDGTAASGVSVNAIPVSILNNPVTASLLSMSTIYIGTSSGQRVVIYQQPGGLRLLPTQTGGVVITDSQGRYRLESLAPDTYSIVTGFSDSPIFFPGTTDSQQATPIVTISTTLLTNLDFTLPPPPKTYSIRGRVSAIDGWPAGGATVNLQNLNSGATPRVGTLLPARSYRPVTTGGDGTFEIPDVISGKYALQARLSVASPLTKNIEVADQAVNIDFDFPVNVLTGRIVSDDGIPFSGSPISQVALSTTSNPNFVATTLLQVSSNGAFSSVIDPGDYRFFVRSLPDGYVVQAMTSGSTDLAIDPIRVDGNVPNTVEIRVAKGLGPGSRVRGKVIDAATGAAPAEDRVDLCCFASGPFERLSSPVLGDGSFDFSRVPPGSYTLVLRARAGQRSSEIVNRKIEVGDQEKSEVLLISATQVASVTANVTFEDGSNVPSSTGLTVSLTISPALSGARAPGAAPAATEVSIPMGRLKDDTYWIPFPTNVRYTISVGNIPEGYKVKSISGPGAVGAASSLAADGGTNFSGVAPSVLSIVLQRTAEK